MYLRANLTLVLFQCPALKFTWHTHFLDKNIFSFKCDILSVTWEESLSEYSHTACSLGEGISNDTPHSVHIATTSIKHLVLQHQQSLDIYILASPLQEKTLLIWIVSDNDSLLGLFQPPLPFSAPLWCFTHFWEESPN